MAQIITVTCPKCGKPIAVNCRYSGGSSTDSGICRNCGKAVYVQYSNDSFGFRIISIR
jgi:endogenous inhibitor of DNA gyrase (YacG/DUF329 family)